jgi:hypothetical protein
MKAFNILSSARNATRLNALAPREGRERGRPHSEERCLEVAAWIREHGEVGARKLGASRALVDFVQGEMYLGKYGGAK